MRLPHWAALAAAFVLSGCFDEHALPETLMFPPGIDIEYLGKPAKLYGTSQCAQGQLTGNSCLIFPPHEPRATCVILSGQQVREVALTAIRDPQDPVRFIVQDAQGRRLLSTTGRHDEHANIQLAPY